MNEVKHKESDVVGIFPTPIYLNKINREFSKEELGFIKKQINYCKQSAGNIYTKDNYILNSNSELKNIEKFINRCIKDYFDKIIRTNNKVTPYITQSWINYTEPNQFHHKHAHQNSYLSGVIYINADKETDSITFWRKEQPHELQLEKKDFNVFNCGNESFPINTGDIVLFPSCIDHSVELVKTKDMRISLAFNVFLRGTLGNNELLTELKL